MNKNLKSWVGHDIGPEENVMYVKALGNAWKTMDTLIAIPFVEIILEYLQGNCTPLKQMCCFLTDLVLDAVSCHVGTGLN